MLYRPSDYVNCSKCGSTYNIFKSCKNCERLEKLKGKKCPCCKSTDIDLIQQTKNNGVMGPGFSSWVVSENFACNDCGVLFITPKNKNKSKKKSKKEEAK